MNIKSNKLTWSIVIVILIIGLIWFIKVYNAGNASNSDIRIGVMAPLTGSAARLGEWTVNGIKLATEIVNSAGGINGSQIQLVIENDACNPKDALNAYQKLAKSDGVKYIVGPLCGAARVPIMPILEQDKILAVTTGLALATSPKTSAYTYNVLPTAKLVAETITDFAFENNFKNFSILYPEDEYGRENEIGIGYRIKFLGGVLVSSEKNLKGAPDLRTQIAKFKTDSSEALIIVAYGPDYATFLKQAQELGLRKPIFAVSSIQVPEAIAVSKETNFKIYYSYPASSNTESVKQFAELYRKRYADAPEVLPMYVGSGYDSLTLLVEAIKSCKNKSDTACVYYQLSKSDKYQGANGEIKFDERGNNSMASAVEIRILEKGEIKIN